MASYAVEFQHLVGPLEETMVDSILEFLITLSLILSGVLAYLLFSARGGRHNRHAH